MAACDLNLLPALDALLGEGSVTGAARRLGLSTSAMSRTLTRLREATGDPLLVRAGRGLVPSPRALALREEVRLLNQQAQAVLRPQDSTLDPATLERDFTLRANEGFIAAFALALSTEIGRRAPGICLRFAPKPSKHPGPLRDGSADLAIGVMTEHGPELRSRLLFRDYFVGAVRHGHPLCAKLPISTEAYAAGRHVVASRSGHPRGPVDAALQALGLQRRIAVVVPGFPDALRLAAGSDLIALIPASCAAAANTPAPAAGAADASSSDEKALSFFTLPVATPAISVSLLWHPRMEADPAHRWLRETVIAVCQQQPHRARS